MRKWEEKLHGPGRKKEGDMFNTIKGGGREMHGGGSKADKEEGRKKE